LLNTITKPKVSESLINGLKTDGERSNNSVFLDSTEAVNNIVSFKRPESTEETNISKELAKLSKAPQSLEADISKELSRLSKTHRNLESNAVKIENFTANTALSEIGIGLTSMLLEGKFSGDNFMYIVNSAEEFLANKTKSLSEPMKEMLFKGASKLGLNVENKEEKAAKLFDENEDKVMATYVRALSVLGIAASSLDHLRTKNESPKEPTKIKQLSKFLSSAIMLLPALPMIATYSAKHRMAELMLKIKPKNPYASKLQLTANEDFICFNEAILLGTRKLLSSLMPNHKRIIELSASLFSSFQSLGNANATLLGGENEKTNLNLFKSKLIKKTIPENIYPLAQKSFSILGLKLPDSGTLDKVSVFIDKQIDSVNQKLAMLKH